MIDKATQNAIDRVLLLCDRGNTARDNPGKKVSHPSHFSDAERVAPLQTVYEALRSIGVDLLEFDVVLTKDAIPVITHNHRLTASNVRQPDGSFLIGEEPKVSSLELSEIERFDIGALDGTTVYGQRFREWGETKEERKISIKENATS